MSEGLAVGLSVAGRVVPAGATPPPVPFGAALQGEVLASDPEIARLYLDHCDLILPMNELKFDALRPARDAFRFEAADRLVDFATRHGRMTRGTTFVWQRALPSWVEAITDRAEAERVLVDHIETVAARYAGRMQGWDVVNEVVAHEPRPGMPLRDTHWLRTLGPRHIPLAFTAAARADRSGQLVFNEYDLECRGSRFDDRRAVVLSLMRKLQDAGVRVDAVGIQAHLYTDRQIDVEALAGFCRTLKSMGIAVLVTELDVIDNSVLGDIAERDAAAGRQVGDLLDGLFAVTRPAVVIAWGMSDRYSWIGEDMPRGDGARARPLPFDEALAPKPWYAKLRARLRDP